VISRMYLREIEEIDTVAYYAYMSSNPAMCIGFLELLGPYNRRDKENTHNKKL